MNDMEKSENEEKQLRGYRVTDAQKMIRDAIRQLLINNCAAPDIFRTCDSLLRLEHHTLFRTHVVTLEDVQTSEDVSKEVTDIISEHPGGRWISSWRRPGIMTNLALIEGQDSLHLFLTEYEEITDYAGGEKTVTLKGKVHEVAINSDFYLSK